jgi:hypothetical protein
MVRKPDIQYVGQFYTYGSEAKEVALQPKKAKTTLPLERLRNIQQIYVDPVAWFGIAVSIVMVITMVIGALNIRNAWAEYEVMHGYVTELQQENVRLELRYQRGYDLKDIEGTAISMGMIPVSEAQTMTIKVTPPVQKEEPTRWEECKDYIEWFIDGLFE